LDNPRKPGNLSFYHNCALDNGMDLNSNLGLREWINSALSPLAPPNLPEDHPYLTEGHHPPPIAKVGQKGQFAFPTAVERPQPADVADLRDQAVALQKDLTDLVTEAATEQASCLPAITKQVSNAATAASMAATAATDAAAVRKGAENYDQLLQDDYKTALKAVGAARQAKDAATASYNRCLSSVPLDPPISVISHQVQFIVAWSANATPTWTLLHFKGPGSAAGSNSLFSAGQINTHTLTITLGAPAAPNGKGLSQEANMQRQNQNFNAAINNLGQKITAPQPKAGRCNASVLQTAGVHQAITE
jgi:hypothetical protein